MTGNELHQGQVLFTTETPVGNVAQVPDNRRYILSQRTIAFEVDERIISKSEDTSVFYDNIYSSQSYDEDFINKSAETSNIYYITHTVKKKIV